MERTELDVLAECMKDNKNLQWKREVYPKSWNAISSWIESRLDKMRGAYIPNIGTFNWELRNDGVRMPVYILADCIIKNHNIKQSSYHTDNLLSLAPSVEINCSTVAIKHSQTLTKEMIAACLQHIAHKMDSYINQLLDFQLVFTFGILYHSRKKIKFNYDLNRLIKILPQHIRPFEKDPRARKIPPGAITHETEAGESRDTTSPGVSMQESKCEDIHTKMSSLGGIDCSEGLTVKQNMDNARDEVYGTALQRWIDQLYQENREKEISQGEKNLCDLLDERRIHKEKVARSQLEDIKQVLNSQLDELNMRRLEEKLAKRTFQSSFFVHEALHDKQRMIINRNSRGNMQKKIESDILEKNLKLKEDKLKRLSDEQTLTKLDMEAFTNDMEQKRLIKLRNMKVALDRKAHEDKLCLIKSKAQTSDASSIAEFMLTQFPELRSPLKSQGGYRGMDIGFDSRR